ncbi:hypothetical protein BGZ96_006404 [Linnemannia gamsii]|uniref:RNI-like protein n=1 Tax=Linnemannia gamsii TaxID=64522 RepID=A0ABQ7KEF9_9FUNG|nr:hypothetical protein BGZ96_006404 [Linnemannia gamsii]
MWKGVQRFRYEQTVELLAVHKNKDTGEFYSCLDDIKTTFPDALRFRVDGVVLNFMRDGNEHMYTPRRIAHYPDDIIDVVCTTSTTSPFPPPPSYISGKSIPNDESADHLFPPSDSMDLPIQTLSIQPNIEPTTTTVASLEDVNLLVHPNPMAHAMQHLQAVLREQAASMDRELQMIKEQAEARDREERIIRNQQQMIDRLIINQQRIEAILVQNYELHEYPIPRMFVILPDPYKRWDPRNSLAERFRLYFLCECDYHSKDDVETTTTPIPVKNSLHLAKHEGYELSRPLEFFDHYGRYVLGMLQILKQCLAVATAVSPVAALTDLKDTMGGLKLISESTVEAVNMSIDFLQQRLGDKQGANSVNRTNAYTQEEDMFSDLAALDGSDLRQLDTFLRNTNADKVLGNLYRITLETGQVKWVCLDHYRQVHRDTAMSSFLESVEANGGTFDPQLSRVTILFKSSTSTKDFFTRLSKQASYVKSLRVTLDWSFSSADLAMLVNKIAQSNVDDLDLDLQNDDRPLSIISLIRFDKGRYHSLLGLLSNTKIKGLTLSNVAFIGPRTSKLPAIHRASLLQNLHYQGKIYSVDDSRLANIISHCPNLVDLRLGSQAFDSEGVPKVDKAIGSLSKLKVLHRYKLYPSSTRSIYAPPSIGRSPYGSVALQELVEVGLFYYCETPLLEAAIQRSSSTLEVLLLDFYRTPAGYVDLISPCKMLPSPSHVGNPSLFSNLTRLGLYVGLHPNSLILMASILPRLTLVQFGVDVRTSSLLAHVNPNPLKSLSVRSMAEDYNIGHFCRAIRLSSSLESLELGSIPITPDLLEVLKAIPLQRLDLDGMSDSSLLEVLTNLDVSQLQVLTLSRCKFAGVSDQVFTTRFTEFLNGFVLHLKVTRESVDCITIIKTSERWQAM